LYVSLRHRSPLRWAGNLTSRPRNRDLLRLNHLRCPHKARRARERDAEDRRFKDQVSHDFYGSTHNAGCGPWRSEQAVG
jgi:hypothetical protein